MKSATANATRKKSEPLREYVITEHQRNVANKDLYKRLLQTAFGDEARIVVSHHILVVRGKDPHEETTEIPAADTILFCPHIMGKVFGERARTCMIGLACCPPAEREAQVRRWLDDLPKERRP